MLLVAVLAIAHQDPLFQVVYQLLKADLWIIVENEKPHQPQRCGCLPRTEVEHLSMCEYIDVENVSTCMIPQAICRLRNEVRAQSHSYLIH